jgi:hypothetical protein
MTYSIRLMNIGSRFGRQVIAARWTDRQSLRASTGVDLETSVV